MIFDDTLQKHWYMRMNLIFSILLLPLSFIYYLIAVGKYYLHKLRLLKSYHLPIPVVIVGNISVGGTGKTPLTKHLVQELESRGIKTGVILRGYKGSITHPHIVSTKDNSTAVGDEALIYANNNIKVAIGANRYLAGLKLLEQYPDIQLILSDDGLQHYRLRRNYEIAVIDGSRGIPNKWVLPMGPLREPISRLNHVDAVVINGTMPDTLAYNAPLTVSYNLILDKIYNPITHATISAEKLHGLNASIMVGIGNPLRFINFLVKLGIHISPRTQHIFPDHYSYKKSDIPDDADIILVTDKDYAKLAQFNNPKIWVVLVRAVLDNDQLITDICSLTIKQDKVI